jgi:hypothetical protein
LNKLIGIGPNQKQDGKPNKKSRLGSTRNNIGQTNHSTIERKIWRGRINTKEQELKMKT